MNGLDTARHLMKRHPDVLILMITADPWKHLEEEAKKAGIRGVCAKAEIHRIHSAIEAVMGGGTYFSEDTAA